MHALEDQLLWPGRFGGGGTDWEVPGALESMANQAVRDLAVTPHAFGPTLSVMQLVDWHCERRVPLSLSVVEALASALGLDDYLRELTAIALHISGTERKQVAVQIGRSLRTVDRFRAKSSYKQRCDAVRGKDHTFAFGLFAIDEWSTGDEAVTEVQGILRQCGTLLSDPRRGDDYSPANRQRLLEIVIWFSTRGEYLPDVVWFACACGLGLATYRGGLRISVGGRHHPQKYHNAVLLDSDLAIQEWNGQVAGGVITPSSKYPMLEELNFSSTNALARQVEVDRKTLSRWRALSAYKLARFVNIIALRRQPDGVIFISRDERNLLHQLVEGAQREHEQQTLSGSENMRRPPRLTPARKGG